MKKEKKLPTQFDITQEEIAKHLGGTRQDIANVEKKALEKARKILAEKGISVEDFFKDNGRL